MNTAWLSDRGVQPYLIVNCWILFFFLGPSIARAADCAQQSYVLDSQADVDALSSGNCSAIQQNLQITGSVNDLGALFNLRSIGGYLHIDNADSVYDLDGLHNIESVGSDLKIRNNSSLNDISQLTKLTTVQGDLEVASNSQLNYLTGLSNITGVSGSLTIDSNSDLNNLDGLSSLVSIGGTLLINNNDEWGFDIDGLSNLTSVGGSITITDNFYLADIDALSGVSEITGSVEVASNSRLTTVAGLGSINSIGGALTVQSNGQLSNCFGLVNVLGYPNGPPSDFVSGAITLGGNATGCNSVQEIFDRVDPPSAPLLTSIRAGDAAITIDVSVIDTGSFPVTSLRGTCTDAQSNTYTSTSNSSTSVTVTGLTNEVGYSCQVTALSDGGESAASEPSITVTPAERPQVDPAVLWLVIKGSGYVEEDSCLISNPPGAPSVTAAEDRVTLSWAPPAVDNDCPIAGYQIQYATSPYTSYQTVVANTGSTSTTYTVAGLTYGTTYVFRVAAIYSTGVDSYSGPSEEVTLIPSTGGNGKCTNTPDIACSGYDFGSAGRDSGGNSVRVDVPAGQVLVSELSMKSGNYFGILKFVPTSSGLPDDGSQLRSWISSTPNGTPLTGEYCAFISRFEGSFYWDQTGSIGFACQLPLNGGSYFWNLAACTAPPFDLTCSQGTPASGPVGLYLAGTVSER